METEDERRLPFDSDGLGESLRALDQWLARHERAFTADGGFEASRMVSRIFASWNQLDGWLRQVEGSRRAA